MVPGDPKTSAKMVSLGDWKPSRKSIVILGNKDKGIDLSLESEA